VGPIQPSIQWVPGALSLGVRRPGREADHSSPSSAGVKNAWNYTSTSQYVFMAWCLVKHSDNFTFFFTFYSILLAEDSRFFKLGPQLVQKRELRNETTMEIGHVFKHSPVLFLYCTKFQTRWNFEKIKLKLCVSFSKLLKY
jgi:hypothetical protein